MSWVRSILREVFGLFVDDASFALSIVVWLGAVYGAAENAGVVLGPVLGAAVLARTSFSVAFLLSGVIGALALPSGPARGAFEQDQREAGEQDDPVPSRRHGQARQHQPHGPQPDEDGKREAGIIDEQAEHLAQNAPDPAHRGLLSIDRRARQRGT
ncbi:MAG: hypothetical protein ABI369_06935, partial [Acetobacteraceae bacterium]